MTAVQVMRLKRREDFLKVSASGDKWVTPGIVVQALKHNLDCIRLGFTVSGKIGNAVARNRGRRRLKALVGEFFPEMTRPGWDIVLIGRTATLDRDFSALRHDLRKALNKLGVISP